MSESTQKTKLNLEYVYWHDPEEKTSGVQKVDWDLPCNDVIKWMEENDVQVCSGNHKCLAFVKDNIPEVADMVIELENGTQCYISELTPIDTNTSAEPCKCPRCGSHDIDAERLETDAGEAWRDVSCDDCGFEWSETFVFHSWDAKDGQMNAAIKANPLPIKPVLDSKTVNLLMIAEQAMQTFEEYAQIHSAKGDSPEIQEKVKRNQEMANSLKEVMAPFL